LVGILSHFVTQSEEQIGKAEENGENVKQAQDQAKIIGEIT
jgi:hypothetical protein